MDLSLDRSLINSSFEGYKLRGQTPLVYSAVRPAPVSEIVPAEKDYSYLRLQEETLVNHLVQCKIAAIESPSFFYIDDQYRVQCIHYKNGHATTELIFNIPHIEEISSDKVTPTLTVVSPNVLAVSDGAGNLYLIKLNESRKKVEKENFTHNLDLLIPLGHPFYIHLGYVKDNQGHFLLSSLHTDVASSEMFVLIEWVVVNLDHSANNASERFWSCKTFKGFKMPLYMSFSPTMDSLLLLCEQEYVLLNPDDTEDRTIMESSKSEKASYEWSQSPELVSVKFSLPPKTSKKDVYCHLSHTSIDLYLHGTTLLKGKLANSILSDASRWIFDESNLELILVKKQPAVEWSSVVVGDSRGINLSNNEEEGRYAELHERLKHYASEQISSSSNRTPESSFNMQQLEECDRSEDDEKKLYCISRRSGTCHHQINVGGQQWLFNEKLEGSPCLSLCLRHDVDGILWTPKTSEDGSLSWIHTTTFNALGYIQASKTEHKYTTAGPGHNFIAISDCDRRIFIYVQGNVHAKAGIQHIVTLPQQESILGLSASQDHIYVLTRTQFYACKVV